MKNLVIYIIIVLMHILKSNAQQADFEIVFLETYYENYLSEVQQDQEDLKEIYLEKVRLPIFQDHFIQSEYAPFMFEDLAKPSLDLTYLKTTIESIKEQKKEIEQIVLRALKNCNKQLTSKKATVYIIPPSSEYKDILASMSGIFGFTSGSTQIVLSLDPTVEGWKKMLEYAIAHEYHHMIWTQQNFHKLTKWTLLDYLVFEGKGDCFAKQLYPKVKTPWTHALQNEQKIALWNSIKPNLENQDFGYQAEVVFGSDRFPQWGGYTIGYEIVKNSLNNKQNQHPKDWINISSEKILNSSGY